MSQTQAQAVIGQPYNKNWLSDYKKEELLVDALKEFYRCMNNFENPHPNNLEALKAYHKRIAPSCRVIFSDRPGFFGLYKENTILINSHILTDVAFNMLFHELWHYAEMRMIKKSELKIVYKELDKTGHRFGGDYLDNHRERAARAFSHFASARTEGLNIKTEPGTASHVFERLFSGEIYKEFSNPRHKKDEFKNKIDNIITYILFGTIIAPALTLAVIIIKNNIGN